MKLLKTLQLAGLTTVLLAPLSQAASFVGWFEKDSPADESSEAGYLNILLAMANNQTQEVAGRTYTTDALFDATGSVIYEKDVNPFKDDDGVPSAVSGTTYSFVLGKYGNRAEVWYLASGETFTIGSKNGSTVKHELSHSTYFKRSGYSDGPGPTPVPDGGTTIAMLGLSLLGLGGARRLMVRKAA